MRPSHSLKSPLHRLSLMVERLRTSCRLLTVQVALPHVASPPALLLTDHVASLHFASPHVAFPSSLSFPVQFPSPI
nr:hypothetical protein Q903MT_gene953 [Picea sitchensis]